MSSRVPDDLTRREREVLDLLRLGLTNEEIAGRLGISLDGSKYHVSQILSKLGVSTREEASRAAEPVTRRWSWLTLPGAAKAAGIAVVVAGLAVVGALAVGVASDENSDSPLSAAADGPRIGEDHWHAPYTVYIGDEKQPPMPSWEGTGIHTHGDGIIHIHPFNPSEEGQGASLARFFEYGGGELTETTMRIPGTSTTWHEGDPVPGDGRPGRIFVLVNSAPPCDLPDSDAPIHTESPGYVPRDGDRISILFAAEDSFAETCPPEQAEPFS